MARKKKVRKAKKKVRRPSKRKASKVNPIEVTETKDYTIETFRVDDGPGTGFVGAGFFDEFPDRLCLVAESYVTRPKKQRRVIAVQRDRMLCVSLARTLMDLAGVRAIRIPKNGKAKIELGPPPKEFVKA